MADAEIAVKLSILNTPLPSPFHEISCMMQKRSTATKYQKIKEQSKQVSGSSSFCLEKNNNGMDAGSNWLVFGVGFLAGG